jgi:hypothetical protein
MRAAGIETCERVMPASIADSFHQISTSGSVGHGARSGVSAGFLLMREYRVVLGGVGGARVGVCWVSAHDGV